MNSVVTLLRFWSRALIFAALGLLPAPICAEDPPDAEVLAALEKQTSIQFRETPLQTVVLYLSDRHKVPIVLDAGAPKDIVITIDIARIKLKDGLSKMVEPYKLEYAAVKDKIVIRRPKAR